MTTTIGPTATHTIIDTTLGALTLVRDGAALTGVYFPHHWTRPARSGFGPQCDDGFDDVADQLMEYLAGRRRTFELITRADGDDFQRQVWNVIAEIPYGATTTYGDIARSLGAGTTAQQVGAAVGRNPLSIVVPCHRVLGRDGTLTGYAGGLGRKRTLLDLEDSTSAVSTRLF